MASNKNDHVVIAVFDSQDFANYGVDLLKKWDNANDEVKLGAIAFMSKKGDKIKTHVPHKTGGGAMVGAVVGVIAAVLTGGASWIVAGMGGSALGAVTGSFFKKSLHLTKEEIEALGRQLDEGKVAVIVTCDDFEVEATSKQLTNVGGVLSSYSVPEDALIEAADALSTAETPLETDVAVEELTVEEVTVEAAVDGSPEVVAETSNEQPAASAEEEKGA